jgi:two-component system sensor histidine kinase HydH
MLVKWKPGFQNMLKVDSYKKQETILILLNILVLAALFLIHIGFISLLGSPSSTLLLVLTARFIVLILELVWIQKLDPETDSRTLNLHTHFSVGLNIAFAFAASYYGGTADSHYSVLMVIPIITAAYRYHLWWTMTIISVAVVLTYLEVWLYFLRNPPSDFSEYFEAATVSLIFLVVGIVVWLLVGNLRGEEQKLQTSLEELERTQVRLLAEERLAAIGQLSSAVAHEIRNPVAMIASSLKMAEKQSMDSPVREEMFNIATKEAKRLENLTMDFLAFAGAKPPEIKTEKIRDILEYAGSLSKARLFEKDLDLRIECDEAVSGKVDASQIQRALLNLLMNAIDAAPEDSSIITGAVLNSNELTIFVENTGEKIPDEIAAKIYEPFFTEKSQGTGLGLSIVRNIARAHGGDIVLARNKDGEVRFDIVLPVRET